MRRYLGAMVVAALWSGGAGAAQAGAHFVKSGFPDSCTTVNCNAATLTGYYQRVVSLNERSDPFVFQVFVGNHECVRLDVISQPTDMELTMVCPDGTVWQNDDRSPENTLPLIKAATRHTGNNNGWWCSVIVSSNTGTGAHGDVRLKYGRYVIGNDPNCVRSTPPQVTVRGRELSTAGAPRPTPSPVLPSADER